MTITSQDARQYIGQTLFDDNGNKVGKIGAIFLDDITGQPEWANVSTGFFGTKESFVPLTDARSREDGLGVPFSKDEIKGAPNVDPDHGHLSTDEEADLYAHYGQQYSRDDSDSGLPGEADTSGRHAATSGRGTGTRDTDARDADSHDIDARADDRTSDEATASRPDETRVAAASGDDAMTRSEERLNVDTERVSTGKARLRKWVETEHQSVDVPVRKEKVRLETEPVTDANRDQAYAGEDISEGEHEITLTEERPVVTTEAVPVERVRVAKEVQEDTRTVQGEVRKERVDLDTDENVPRR